MMKDAHEDATQPEATRRVIRSFVVRAGRATAAQQRALTELWPIYGIEYTAGRLDLDRAFGRSAPRLLEIGFGAGEALLAFAQANPQIDCLGIEVHPPGVGHLLLQTHAAGLSNVRIVCHDAVEVLKNQLAAASIAIAHIFFADPWPKKRHHKRRLLQPEFVELLARVMQPDATLRLATDWEHYAQHMLAVLDASAHFKNCSAGDGFVERTDARPLTRFERRGQRLGYSVWDVQYRRI